MKIKVSITREYDTSSWSDEDDGAPWQGDEDTYTAYALHLFSEDIDRLVKYNEVSDATLIEVSR